jgi:uncharacterized protein
MVVGTSLDINLQKKPVVFSLLAKPAGAACNLACEYCFYMDKTQLYPGSQFRMSDTVLESYIRQLFESQQTPEVDISWQGGEPTLIGLEFFKRSIEMVRKYKKPGRQVGYSIQTNGTLLDDEWCAFLKQNDFLVGLSVDGPPELHNHYRMNKGGQGSFAAVERAWDLLQKYRVDTNILCAVHARNGSHPLEVYRFFRDSLQAEFIQFIPIVEQLRGCGAKAEDKKYQVSQRSVGDRQFGRFMIGIFDEWVRHDVGHMFIQTFDSALASWIGLPASVCIFQDSCGRSLVLEHNGDLYSCDHFVDPAYWLGNIMQTPLIDLASSAVQLQFGANKYDKLPPECKKCDVVFACHGECPRNRFKKSSNGDFTLNYLCEGYRDFFHHIDRPMRLMAGMLRSGRAPAEIMKMNR